MKSLKVLSIIGLVIAAISFICLLAFNSPYNYESAFGWAVIAVAYLVALSIVSLVKAVHYSDVDKK